MEPHWTDGAAAPVFTTRIPRGNIFSMVGAASRMLRELGVPADRAEALQQSVENSNSYQEACGHIARWFPLWEVAE